MFEWFWLLKFDLAMLKELFCEVSYLVGLVMWELYHVRLWVIDLIECDFDHVWLIIFKRWLLRGWPITNFHQLLPIFLVKNLIITPKTLTIWIKQWPILLNLSKKWVFEVNFICNHWLIDPLMSSFTFISHYNSLRWKFSFALIWDQNVFRNNR